MTTAASRRQLAGRPAETVDALLDAVAPQVRETGYDGLTVRNVAKRAGVSAATAYTYFASKEHLVIEVLWRRVQSLPEVSFKSGASAADRVAEVTATLADMAGDEPGLAAAFTTALLAHDADVKLLRDRLGATIAKRIIDALGEGFDAEQAQLLVMTFYGALLAAGMGNIPHSQVPVLLRRATSELEPRKSRRTK